MESYYEKNTINYTCMCFRICKSCKWPKKTNSFLERRKRRGEGKFNLAPLTGLQGSLEKEETEASRKAGAELTSKLNELETLAKEHNFDANHPAHHARTKIADKSMVSFQDKKTGYTIRATPLVYVSNLLRELWEDIFDNHKRTVKFHEDEVTGEEQDLQHGNEGDKSDMYGGNAGNLYLKGKRAHIWDDEDTALFKEMQEENMTNFNQKFR